MPSHLLTKQGQVHIQETILVVFIFVILLIVGAAFFIRFQESGIQQENKNYQREQFNLLISTLPTLPTLSCSTYTETKTCMDTLKLTSFSILAKKDLFPELGYKTITVARIYPHPTTKKCTATTLPDCGVWEIYAKKPANAETTLKTATPLSLYDPLTSEYSIGFLEIEGYNL